jgi:hypothetical protein
MMGFQQWLDSIPIVGFFLLFIFLSLVTVEAGYRLGHWWQTRTADEQEGPTGMLVGSLLALMAFLLAITMGMASDRFDTRRQIVLQEANALGTVYLRASLLPEPASSEIRERLREYAAVRIASNDLEDLRARVARSIELHDEVWSITEEMARVSRDSEILALFIDSLNAMIDLHGMRLTSGYYARVPETVLLLLLAGTLLTLSMVGYNAGLSLRRGPLASVVLILILGAVITLVVDLDRPRDGFLEVSQQPLFDLLQQIGAPPGESRNGRP